MYNTCHCEYARQELRPLEETSNNNTRLGVVGATHQHVDVEQPAVFPRADAQAAQVHAALVVEHAVQRVGELHAQLLPAATFELWGGVRRAEEEKGESGVDDARLEAEVVRRWFFV